MYVGIQKIKISQHVNELITIIINYDSQIKKCLIYKVFI